MTLDETFTVLRPSERAALLRLRTRDPWVRDVLGQLERVLMSRAFHRVQRRARDFLVFAVAMKLLGREDRISQTAIAIQVFGDTADFNPLETSRVRVAGMALRERLDIYSNHEGRDEAIQIRIPLGTYVPEIRDRRIAMCVEDLSNWGPEEDRKLGEALTSELILALSASSQLVVGRCPRGTTPLPGLRYRLQGALESSDVGVRLHASLFDLHRNRIACSRDFEAPRKEALALSAQVAHSITNGILATNRPRGAASDSEPARHPREHAPETDRSLERL